MSSARHWPVIPVALIAFVMTASAVPLARAATTLVLPWPDGAAENGGGGHHVAFPSHSPFALSDVGTGPDRDPPTAAAGMLFLPQAASPPSPVPAVVLLHGAAGVLDVRELTYARQFAERGVAALVIDVFAPRRDRATGFLDRLLEITEAMFLADAYAALRHLARRAEIDRGRIALIGFSYGGMVATYAAYAQIAERYAPAGERFAAHIAFYAPCIAEFEDNRATGAPLLMLFGRRDALVDPARCARVAAELESGGAAVRSIAYDGAVHQWDGWFAGEREMGRNLASCRFVVERNGTVRDRHLRLPMSNSLLRKAMLGLCADDSGYLIGRDDRVRARSNHDMGLFLEQVFNGRKGRPPPRP